MELTEIIKDKIKNEGPITFRDFMDLCLDPEPGCPSLRGITGEHAYYDSSFLFQAFGAMVGRQLEEMWTIMGEKAFTIVEYGTGSGLLGNDILNYLKRNDRFYDQVNYCIIEKNAATREKTNPQLRVHEKVKWLESIREIPPISGCVLSNGFVDNFSVHQVVMEHELMEVFVDYNNGFTELLLPAAPALNDYLDELNIVVPRGGMTEINLKALDWMNEISSSLRKGYVVTIDFGYNSKELYQKFRNGGKLTSRHNLTDRIFQEMGAQDITSHVNFSALCHWGIKHGLYFCGYTNQAHFLLGLGLTDYLKKTIEKEPDNFINYKKEAFLKRKLLIDMGNRFKVLVQRKGIGQQELQGLRLHNEELFPAKTEFSLVA